jgi:hypothetical protein
VLRDRLDAAQGELRQAQEVAEAPAGRATSACPVLACTPLAQKVDQQQPTPPSAAQEPAVLAAALLVFVIPSFSAFTQQMRE